MQGAYNGERYSNTINTDVTNQRVEEIVDGTVTTTFVGFSAPGTRTNSGRWLIKRIVVDTADSTTVITFAFDPTLVNTDGTGDRYGLFNKKWSQKETYNYDN
jgi:hypothetical protein